jgi:hypothetical protein
MIGIQPHRRAAQDLFFYRKCIFDAQNLSGQSPRDGFGMKLAGFLLLLSGWIIVIATLPLLPSSPMRAAFVLAGMGVELIGLSLVVHSHRVPKG